MVSLKGMAFSLHATEIMIVLVHNTVKKNGRGLSVGRTTPVLVYRVSHKFSNVPFHIDIRTIINLYLDSQ